jgi:hypothetical protein
MKNVREKLIMILEIQKDIAQLIDDAGKTKDFGIGAVDKTKSMYPNIHPIGMRLFPRGKARPDSLDLELDTVVRVVMDTGDCLALAKWAEHAAVNLDEDDVVCVEIRGALAIDDEGSQRLFEIVRDRHDG